MQDSIPEKESLSRMIGEAGKSTTKPPLMKWNPPLSGDIDIEIKSNGQWFHEGDLIHRKKLVQLFSRIMRRESDGHYYLVTPVEKWRIRVEELPFVAASMTVLNEGRPDQQLQVTLNTDEVIVIDQHHPLILSFDPDTAEPYPKVKLDYGLEAKVARQVYYQLVEIGYSRSSGDTNELYINSAGREFLIGRY